jgi:hypothetical protein
MGALRAPCPITVGAKQFLSDAPKPTRFSSVSSRSSRSGRSTDRPSHTRVRSKGRLHGPELAV